MPTPAEYVDRIKKLRWPGLQKLWEAIKRRDTPGWDPGKAFEYLILRAFELDGALVRWPYSVDLFGEEFEQIDGSLQVSGLYCIVESKDESENIDAAPIAKLRNQLLRRPWGTVGMLFASEEFAAAAVQVAYFSLPQVVLLWTRYEVDYCLNKKKFREFCERKYRKCVDEGIPDFDISTGGGS